ncbi:MAG: cytochrome-c peroxidase [Saprospiraceae bacterium]
MLRFNPLFRYFAFGLLFFSSCTLDKTPPVMVVTPYEFDLPDGFPIPDISTEKTLSQERIALGKMLFHDVRLSRDNTISCASCHLQESAFADHNPVSVGIEGRIGFRNSPTLVNVAYHPYFFKEGGNTSLEAQAFGPIEDHREMDFSTAGIILKLQDDLEIQEMSYTAFGRAFDNFVIVNALGSFQRTIISANSRYDDFFYKNNINALTNSEKRGLALFKSERTQCQKCHGGFDFSEYAIVNNGTYANYEDKGLARITQDSSDVGKFKVPTLRNIELTYPYMHNGGYPTLESVIERYNLGGFNHPNQSEFIKPLNLTETEKMDLIAFLKSLTDWDLINNPAFK